MIDPCNVRLKPSVMAIQKEEKSQNIGCYNLLGGGSFKFTRSEVIILDKKSNRIRKKE